MAIVGVNVSTTAADVNNKEFEAGLSLLHMMQRGSENENDMTTIHTSSSSKESTNTTVNGSSLNDALLLAAARQVSPITPPKPFSTSRGFQFRNSQLFCELTINDLRPYFGKPIVEVAKEFGICTTFLKKICRRCGIKRWPHRQIRSLSRTIEILKEAEANATSLQEKMKLASQIAEQEAKMHAVMEDPDTNGKLERVKKSVLHRSNSPSGMSTTTSKVKETIPTAVIGSNDSGDALLQVVAAMAATEGATTSVQPTKPTIDTMNVSIDSSRSLMTVTPTAVVNRVPISEHTISPSHKILSLMKNEHDGLSHHSSTGSLHEQKGNVSSDA